MEASVPSHLQGGDNTPEIRHNVRQDSPYLGRDSNRAPTE